MLHERVLRLDLRLPEPFSYTSDESLLDAARLQFPEGKVFGLQLILRYVELVDRSPIEITLENGTGEGRVTIEVRALVFTVEKNETLHGCVVSSSHFGMEVGTKRRTVQLGPDDTHTVHMEIVLVESVLQESGTPLPLQDKDVISMVVDEATYARQTGNLGIYGRALCKSTLPQNEFRIGAGDVPSTQLDQLREDLQLANRQLEQLKAAFPHLEKVRNQLYGTSKQGQSLVQLLRPRAFNMKRVRMPHPWTGSVEVTPLDQLSLTVPPAETLQVLVELVQRSVREMRDLAESVPAVPTTGRAKKIFTSQVCK